MAKQTLSAAQAFELKQALHIAVLDALMASRRWEPGQLVFQGGTSLHLAHGSPRYSEDLDFLVDSSLNINNVAPAVQGFLGGVNWLPAGTALVVSKAKDAHNPHSFNVTVSGPNVLGSVKVKVELWQTAPEALMGLQIAVAPIQAATGPVSGLKAYVPTAELSEIYADKVFAVVARNILKARDVFDIHWLVKHNGVDECSVDQMKVRLLTYPNMKSEEWLEKAFERRAQLGDEKVCMQIASNLQRWLPSSWPMTADAATVMAKTTIETIENGIDVMRTIRDEYDKTNGMEP